MRVVIAGGSGLIGRRLAIALRDRGDETIVLSRRPETRAQIGDGIEIVGWDPHDPDGSWTTVLRETDAVVNLAGASVGSWPWTTGRMNELVQSRLVATSTLVTALGQVPESDRPSVLLNASGTDMYEGRDEQPATEDTPPADTFLARLCLDWEAAGRRAEEIGVRVVWARMSLVIDRRAPALQRFALPVKLFAGGRFGSGRQWITWIHIADAVSLILAALDSDAVRGPLNVAANDACRQAEFSSTMARVLHRPFWLTVPAALIRLALGKQATLVLGSRRVRPARAQSLGFAFRYSTLEEALEAELG